MSLDISKVAELARIHLRQAEKEKIQKDLDAILGYVHKLDSLNTEGVGPTSHVLDMENVFRPDQVESSNIREKVLKIAPQKEGWFFKVPKVVDKE